MSGLSKSKPSKTPNPLGPTSTPIQRNSPIIRIIDDENNGDKSRAAITGNVADIIDIINVGKSSDTASMVNYEWMTKLREGSRRRNPGLLGPKQSINTEAENTIKLSGPPNLSYISNPVKIRKMVK